MVNEHSGAIEALLRRDASVISNPATGEIISKGPEFVPEQEHSDDTDPVAAQDTVALQGGGPGTPTDPNLNGTSQAAVGDAPEVLREEPQIHLPGGFPPAGRQHEGFISSYTSEAQVGVHPPSDDTSASE